MKAVIQAGGKGTRLRPYTLILPKPLMPVGEHPVIELLLKWLRRNNIHEIYITTGHLGHLIRSLCGNGRQWDCEIYYTEEPEPLGTVGALDLIRDQLNETFLVLNGDLITDLGLRDFTDFHRANDGLLSMCVTQKTVKVDLGVVESELATVTSFREKPTFSFETSMGIYCMEPQILDLIPQGVPFGFDDLMHTMLEDKLPVYTYLHEGCWLDIGRPEDFQEAQNVVNGSDVILGI